VPYSVPPLYNSNGASARGVPGHAPQPHPPPHPQPPPPAGAGAAGPAYYDARAQYASYPASFGPTASYSSTHALGSNTFSPQTTSGTQSRSGSVVGGGVHSGASSSSGGYSGAAGRALPLDMTVNLAMENSSAGGAAPNSSKRARSDDTGSGLSGGGGTPKGRQGARQVLHRFGSPLADPEPVSAGLQDLSRAQGQGASFRTRFLLEMFERFSDCPTQCDRRWPKCQRCRDRGEECDFGSMVPGELSLRRGARGV
jgi:hypothetical protein